MEKSLESNKQELINSIIKAVSYKSVSIKTDSQEAPFGEECKNVLEYVLSLGRTMGFKTKNIDGYCGYIEFSKGKEMLGIIGHLDVVPANIEDGWTSDPFKAEIRNNKIYGRGTIDDKGPVLAALYAMKIVSETTKLNKRVRLIIGLNEEKDWECIKRYKETEELPTISFSPDANFPCIYAEKSIATLTLSKKIELSTDKIIEINCGNNAINVVPKSAIAIIETITPEKYQNKKDIQVEIITANKVKITAKGTSSHAAFPTLGDNAITKLIKYLNEVSPTEYLNKLIEEGFFELENPKYLGGENLTDESGKLTSNIGFIEYKDNILTLKTNLRIPVNTSFETIEENCDKLVNIIPGTLYELTDKNEKLYISKENYLVQTLTNIFNEETNLQEEPIAIGGGTYARAFPNCISYGMTMPNEEELCHQVDENIDIDNLLLATRIYAKAIIALAN